jgi:excisionase family DNA binding protein
MLNNDSDNDFTGYTIDETCERLKCSRSLVYSLIRHKKLERIKVGRRTLIRGRSIRAVLSGEAA